MELLDSRIKKVENTVTKVLEYAVSAAFTVILLLTILLVFLRYFFKTTILGGGGNELIGYLFIYTTALGAAVSICKRQHIKIDYFLSKLRQPYRMLIDSFGQLSIAAINTVIVLLSFNWIQTVGYSESPVLRWPMWTIYISVPVGCILVSLFSLMNIYSIIRSGLAEMRSEEE